MSVGQDNKGEHDVFALHQGLVEQLVKTGNIRTAGVEAAFRAVPRHVFLPELAVDEVYRDEAIATKYLNGSAISSSSQPAIMAIMLEQLELLPGQRVLEIGAGTGYNAALMAHIVGDTGQVVTVDLDDDTAERAREHLAAAGFDGVQVVSNEVFYNLSIWLALYEPDFCRVSVEGALVERGILPNLFRSFATKNMSSNTIGLLGETTVCLLVHHADAETSVNDSGNDG